MFSSGYYSKISYNWNNTVDVNKKLEPWLDPAHTGTLELDGMKSNCAALDTVKPVSISSISLDHQVNVFPNPATSGDINIQFNLPAVSGIKAELIDINGKVIRSYMLSKVQSGRYRIDVSNLANGIYLLNISDGFARSGKKIVIRH